MDEDLLLIRGTDCAFSPGTVLEDCFVRVISLDLEFSDDSVVVVAVIPFAEAVSSVKLIVRTLNRT